MFLSSTCKKEDSPSQKGANIMTAKIDGRFWEKKSCFGCGGGGDGLGVEYDDSGYLAVGGYARGYANIGFVAHGVLAPGDYPLYSITGNYAQVHLYENSKTYYTTAQSNGTLHITKLDFEKKILSGTFEFTAEEQDNPSNTIRVTNGILDITFQLGILNK